MGNKKKGKKKESAKIPAPVVIFVGMILLASAGGATAKPVRHAITHAVTSVFSSSGPVNEQLADKLAADSYGWTGSQATCLNQLWSRETGGTWDSLITDPLSGSFGIAQALGHGLPSTAVNDPVIHLLEGSKVVSQTHVRVDEYPVTAANAGNARAQINWGLAYIQGKYGTPCGAWDDTDDDASGY